MPLELIQGLFLWHKTGKRWEAEERKAGVKNSIRLIELHRCQLSDLPIFEFPNRISHVEKLPESLF